MYVQAGDSVSSRSNTKVLVRAAKTITGNEELEFEQSPDNERGTLSLQQW